MIGAVNSLAYGASKWAVRGMTRSAAMELGRFGIRVNSIHPCVIDTDMIREAGIPAEGNSPLLRGNAFRRAAQADEVAYLALYLASDESSYSTGSEFVVDGGAIA